MSSADGLSADLIQPGDPEVRYDDPIGDSPLPLLRIVVGLGDAERERHLLSELDDSHGFAVTGRCLSADDLLPQVSGRPVDAVLVAADLHHLSRDVMSRLLRHVPRIVLLTPDRSDEAEWRQTGVRVLQLSSPPVAIGAALRGEAAETPLPLADRRLEPEPLRTNAPVDSTVLAITGGQGSPGRTTVAVNLAACLGAVASTVLVDGDLSSPAIAAHLDADPTRNIYMLAHAAPRSSLEWDRALEQEVQPIGAGSPQGVVLCGVPKPEMRGRIAARFFGELLAELSQRFRYVVVDAGGDLGEASGEVGRLVVEQARHVLLVGTPDLVGLAQVRRALQVVRRQNGEADRLALVLNRYHRRHHPSRQEIEWALDIGLAAIVPQDYHAAERALIAQQPLVLDRHSRAARALLELSGRVHGGDVLLPADLVRAQERRQPGRLVSRLPVWKRRSESKPTQGVADGHLAGA